MLCGVGHGVQVCDGSRRSYLVAPESCGRFGYFFPDARNAPDAQGVAAKLDALAIAMIEQQPTERDESRIPPVFTYLGQFIDHDITAGTDRELAPSVIDSEHVAPLARKDVLKELFNLRTGQLDLDSLYGDKSVIRSASKADQAFLEKLVDLMRFPGDPAKMWVAFYDRPEGGVPLPDDRAGDLLRLGRLISPVDQRIPPSQLDGLSDSLRDVFTNLDGSPNIHRAIIGDGRNDENLIVSQLHQAMLRFHNRIVDTCRDPQVLAGGPDAVFEWARQQVRWTYQWLVINSYLPAICDPNVLEWSLDQKAPVYAQFLTDNAPCGEGRLPLPLEFSVAAFRFGHSMVRPTYDWNRFFGRMLDGSGDDRATFEQMFAFTGGGRMNHLPVRRLPAVWGAEWDRMTSGPSEEFPDRAARRIDTRLAPPLGELPLSSGVPVNTILGHLAKRNLRRGHLLNLPCAQDCIKALGKFGLKIDPLTEKDLAAGDTGAAVLDGGFESRTPLWFYILKEAEIRADGQRLGPLGSAIIADTLVGLVINDPHSYWGARGGDGGRWSPKDGPKPAGEPVDDIAALLRAAAVHK